MRLRPEIYQEIRQAAERNRRSIAAEAEQRLVQQPAPQVHAILQTISSLFEAVEKRAGKTWEEDEAVREQCRSTAEFVLNMFLGPVHHAKSINKASERYLVPKEEVIKMFKIFVGDDETSHRIAALFAGQETKK